MRTAAIVHPTPAQPRQLLYATARAWRHGTSLRRRRSTNRSTAFPWQVLETAGGAGCDSNPRPADYEKYGPALRMRYLHRYHGVVPPMALIAPIARVTRSTNRSTPYHGDHRVPATERYRRPADQRMPAPGDIRPPEESPNGANRRATGSDYKHEIIRRVHQERDQAPAVRAEMQ
jgi:hypothetical protein